MPDVHGVVRRRLIDLTQRLWDEFTRESDECQLSTPYDLLSRLRSKTPDFSRVLASAFDSRDSWYPRESETAHGA